MSKKNITLVLGIFIAVTASNHAHAWAKMEGVGKAAVKGIASLEAEWVKDKGDKWDVSLKFTNESSATILFFAGDMKCARGKEESPNVDIHSDRRTIDLRTKESRTVLITCRGLTPKGNGDFRVTMKAFSNPTGDSNTPGKVLIEKMTWKQGENEGKKL